MKTELTLEEIKSLVSFPKDSGQHYILMVLIDCWFAFEKQNGKNEQEALKITRDNLRVRMLELEKS